MSACSRAEVVSSPLRCATVMPLPSQASRFFEGPAARRARIRSLPTAHGPWLAGRASRPPAIEPTTRPSSLFRLNQDLHYCRPAATVSSKFRRSRLGRNHIYPFREHSVCKVCVDVLDKVISGRLTVSRTSAGFAFAGVDRQIN
jgi:hypothetical protein